MKILFLFVIAVCILSCSKSSKSCDLDPCNDPCLFVLEEQAAVTAFISCFDRHGFLYMNQDSLLIAIIPDEIDNDLKVDGIPVSISGYARKNELPLTFPDPSVGGDYQFESVCVIRLTQ